MPNITCLYLDDSGTRNPNRKPDHGQYRDWFALGGIMIHEEREDEVRAAHDAFCQKWQINYPLHSFDIRQREGRFSWLATLPEPEYAQFMSDLTDFLVDLPVLGHGCVIDRPGYEGRYRAKYGRQQWMLCKTAFAVLCERVAKIADSDGRKVRVFPEAGDPTADEYIRDYFKALRTEGMPFTGADREKYTALSSGQLKSLLYDLKFKNKFADGADRRSVPIPNISWRLPAGLPSLYYSSRKAQTC